MTDVGSGGHFNGPYGIDVKYGMYSYYNDYGNNFEQFPTTLETALGALGQWTIEFWYYFPDMDMTGGIHALTIVSRGAESPSAGQLFLQILDTSWDPWGNNGSKWFFEANGNSIFLDGIAHPYPGKGWRRISINWTGSVYNLYLDGTIIATLAGASDLFSSTAENGTFYLGSEFGSSFGNSYRINEAIDRLIISDIDRQGLETGYGCFSPTVTQTWTITSKLQ
jgi:hypothetical protein